MPETLSPSGSGEDPHGENVVKGVGEIKKEGHFRLRVQVSVRS